ncbi:hypothetical protein RA19_02395 [Leisingera sp. ANG-M1]|uniref:M15 family metallopeptidase n=1 Tax=Leisingera sp. ANG-M1 TaxID=1577895 RepID=UPI00058006F8|nr:M15 family metallopeptidase [Leisingera sp. ANG-M1]KIC12120.1 hypothetical protein RA19_02395 [Leisingera sp. ANG-M1]
MPLQPQSALNWDAAQTISAGTSREPLVPASPSPHWITWPVYFHNGVQAALPEIWVREAVYDRLITAAQSLPPQYRLVVLDGWRPKTVQNSLFEGMRCKLALQHPELPGCELDQRALLYAARASDDPARPSPHITGGAVDVALADADGRFLNMGSTFDEASERSWTAAPVAEGHEARRRCLLDAMLQAGFTNLPSEWWHFDYGNWVWAWYRNKASAIYGPAEIPAI